MSSPGAEVVIADHEPEVGEMSRRYLARAGLSARVLASAPPALAALASRDADAFVIDLTMPGLEAAAVRKVMGPSAPAVVFLLDRHGIRPRSLADGPQGRREFLARPFSPRALVEAVTGLLRPAAPAAAPEPLHAAGGQFQLDAGRRRVTLAGREVGLTRTEFALVTALAEQAGRTLSRQQLLAALEAERGKRPTARAIDVYITQLRAKLGPEVIQTVHGVGYTVSAMP
jgi:DNA-binding response OmpR family regulator